MLKMNLITQEELCDELYWELCDELYWELCDELYEELNREVWMEVGRQLGFPIHTKFLHSKISRV
jgi:hypothetical protein